MDNLCQKIGRYVYIRGSFDTKPLPILNRWSIFCPQICAPPSATPEMSPEICPCFHLVPYRAATPHSSPPSSHSVLNRRRTSPIVYSIVLGRRATVKGWREGCQMLHFSITTKFGLKSWCIVFWMTYFDNRTTLNVYLLLSCIQRQGLMTMLAWMAKVCTLN